MSNGHLFLKLNRLTMTVDCGVLLSIDPSDNLQEVDVFFGWCILWLVEDSFEMWVVRAD